MCLISCLLRLRRWLTRERALDNTVTEFLLRTCRVCSPSRSKHAVCAALLCGVAATSRPDNELHTQLMGIPLATGSVAEFYIEPLLPHVGDIDVMFHWNNQLAIPRGHPLPTQLPAEFHNCVQVNEIIDMVPEIADSHLPGYVYLELRYSLTACSDGNYNAVEYDRGQYAGNRTHRDLELHGPAALFASPQSEKQLSVDMVYCVRCLSWPPQAYDWPTRHRNYDWPDSATLDCVVSNGCDVVPVAHRQCRQHELMGNLQWRLSLSRAEIVLMNSWMPVQQIVYHMLRYFVKTEQLTDCSGNAGAGTISNYHIKTLMLWACELKLRIWWTDDVNLVRMCVQLLHMLAEWLTDAQCIPHYFINNCNLIDNSFDVANVRDQLMSIDERWLSTWFADNYMRKCSQLNDCPQNISRLFDYVTTSLKLQNAVSALVAWRQNSSLSDLWHVCDATVCQISSFVDKRALTERSCLGWMTQLTKNNSGLSVYFTAVAFLHVASMLLRHGLND